MVTLQILVLSFLVRVRVSQLSKAYSLRIGFFRILPYPTFFGSTLHCTHKKTNTGISDSVDAACEQLYPRMSEIPVFCYYIMIALFKDILYTLL